MKNLNWELLHSKYVYKDRWFIARADSCKMPDGRVVEPYYVLEFPNWCNVVAFNTNNEILMVRQYRHALGKTTIELPGGVIDKNETPAQAAVRETLEETGYNITTPQLLYSTSPNPATNNNTAYFFVADVLDNTHAVNFDAFEDLEVLFIPYQKVVAMIYSSAIIHGVQVGAIFAALHKKNLLF